MNSVVLTFPGHFFQTALCLESLQRHYPEHCDHITIIADDVKSAPWDDYVDDLHHYFSNDKFTVIPVSSLPGIRDCTAGWWRQQLVKLTLDQILPDQSWFVVDGDTIFVSRCEVQHRIPISRRCDDSRWSQMCKLYVKGLLGVDHGTLMDCGQAVTTSAIPFRYLDRATLGHLRHHVQSRFQGDFLDLHLKWFADQTIVADIDPPTKWVMSEWELIECFRLMVQGHELPYQDIGSGYQIDVDLDQVDLYQGIFLHSYKRDFDIGVQWFRNRGLSVPDSLWQKMAVWHDVREVRRIV